MLGDRIRKVRKANGLTLNELAEASGLTSSYISQVERNLTEPSLSSLRKISAALGLPLYTFLDEAGGRQTFIIRANERKKLILPNSSIAYEFLSPTGASVEETPKLEVVFFRLSPKSWSRDDYVQHAAEECIIVLSGAMDLDCGDTTHHLYEGDSIYISNSIPHKAYNPGNVEMTAISCFTPPTH